MRDRRYDVVAPGEIAPHISGGEGGVRETRCGITLRSIQSSRAHDVHRGVVIIGDRRNALFGVVQRLPTRVARYDRALLCDLAAVVPIVHAGARDIQHRPNAQRVRENGDAGCRLRIDAVVIAARPRWGDTHHEVADWSGERGLHDGL